MKLIKREKIYYVVFKRGKMKSLRTQDETEANRRYRLLEQDLLVGKLAFLQTGESALALGDFFAEYDRWVEYNRSHETWLRVHRVIPKFTGVVGSRRPLKSLQFKDLDNYVDYCRKRKNGPVTINVEIKAIKAALSWGVKRQYLKTNPFFGYGKLREQKKIPVFLTAEQVQDVFNAIGNDKYKLVFALYVYTGARRGEISRLQWTDVKKDVIEISVTKNSFPRRVPIIEHLRTILDEYRKDIGRIVDEQTGYMAQRMKFYLREAKLGHVRPHDLRHTFASHLVMGGQSLRTVGELLGHKSYASTMIYAHLSNEHLFEAMKAIKY